MSITAIDPNLNGIYSVRTDLVYKSIIRDFRRYYNKEFNRFTHYISKKRFKKNDYY